MQEERGVVLLVGNDRGRMGEIAQCLNDAGFRVLTEFREDLVMVATWRALPRLVIVVDMLCPAVDGARVIAGLRLNRYRGKILALSGRRHVKKLDLLSIAEMMGADEARVRPRVSADLVMIVQTLLASNASPPLSAPATPPLPAASD